MLMRIKNNAWDLRVKASKGFIELESSSFVTGILNLYYAS